MKIKPRHRDIGEIYRYFARNGATGLGFTDRHLIEMIRYESTGRDCPTLSENGFYYGFWSMSLTLGMWAEDIPKGLVFYHDCLDGWPDNVREFLKPKVDAMFGRFPGQKEPLRPEDQ